MQEVKFRDNDEVMQQFYTTAADKFSYQRMIDRMDSDVPDGAEVVRRIKIGRNSECPCGSGKKFKKCCIRKAKQV